MGTSNDFSSGIHVRGRLLVLALGGLWLSGAAFAQAGPPDVFYNRFTTAGGIEVWTAPGPVITNNRSAGVNRTFTTGGAQGTGGMLTEVGEVTTQKGSKATFTARRTFTAGGAFAAARFLTGPYGAAAAIALPAFMEWFDASKGTDLRTNATRDGFEKKDPTVCTVAPCWGWTSGYGGSWPTREASCAGTEVIYNAGVHTYIAKFLSVDENTCYGQLLRKTDGSVYLSGSIFNLSQVQIAPENQPGWLPASMDDIEPYMTARPPPPSYPQAVLDAKPGIGIPAANDSISGPTPGPSPQLPPVVKKEETPYKAPQTTTSSRAGNPSGLAPNTPTVTSTRNGSTPVTLNGKPANQPWHETTTSTYDPAADRTTDVTTRTHDTIRSTVTTTTNQTFTYNTTNVENKVTNQTTTVIYNITNNSVISTDEGPVNDEEPKPPEPEDPCKKDPDLAACSRLDTVDGPKIPKVNKTLTYTAESVLGGGSCPADKFTNVGGHQVKAWDWQQACGYITSYVKPVILAAAAFIALIIIMPGGMGRTE